MKIVVTTPAGHVGSRVVRLLLQADVRPALLARHPARLDPRVIERADVVQADRADADAVVRAIRDADGLFWVAPDTADPDAGPAAWYARLGANAARAGTEHGIARTVFLSSIGAEMRSGAGAIDGQARTEELLDDGQARTEELLDATGASVLYLRCGFCFTNLLFDLDSLRNGVVRVAAAVDYSQPWVDPRDIGDVAAARLLAGAWSGRHVQAVHGPDDLTLTQVAGILTEALGRPIRAETISDDAQRRSLRSAGFGEKQVEGIVAMSAVMRQDFVPEQERSIIATTPTTLAAWVHVYLRHLLQPESAA